MRAHCQLAAANLYQDDTTSQSNPTYTCETKPVLFRSGACQLLLRATSQHPESVGAMAGEERPDLADGDEVTLATHAHAHVTADANATDAPKPALQVIVLVCL